MAKYSIELRKICDIFSRIEVENWFKDYEISDYLLPKELEIVNNSPIWNKDKLAKMIVDHYFMREIGFETPYLFKHYANLTMREIMGKYLPLIYSKSLEYDLFVNEDYTETFIRHATGSGISSGNSTSKSNSNADGLSLVNDTPQTNINKQDIKAGFYATSINQSETNSQVNSDTNTSSDSSQINDEEYTRKFKGNHGVLASAQKLIEQYRDNIININLDIIKELNSLFMGLY